VKLKKLAVVAKSALLLPSTMPMCPLHTSLTLDHVLFEILPHFEWNQRSLGKLDSAFSLTYGTFVLNSSAPVRIYFALSLPQLHI